MVFLLFEKTRFNKDLKLHILITYNMLEQYTKPTIYADGYQLFSMKNFKITLSDCSVSYSCTF